MTATVKVEMSGEALEGTSEKVAQGTWDGRCHDPCLRMFKAAYMLATNMGIRPEDIPDLRSENGVLHAYTPNGAKLRLEAGQGWERESGYTELLIDIRARS